VLLHYTFLPPHVILSPDTFCCYGF